MDTSLRADIESKDIIARIMAEMEEVIGLIHRPSRQEPPLAHLPLPGEATATLTGSQSTSPDTI